MTKARGLADLGDSYGGADGALSNRNMVINGAMNVAQRSASVTGIGASAGYFTCDRWRSIASSTAGRLTQTQAADGPSGVSANCLKLDCTTADTSIAAGEFFILQQQFEGQDMQRIGKGVAGAKQITLSFYVKSNAALTFGAELFDTDNGRQITKLFTTTTDWVRHELTYAADVDDGSSPIADDNGHSLEINFWLHSGATYSSGTLSSAAWVNYTNANRAAGIDSFFSSTDNEFFITGVQMEVGDVATPFENRSYADELAACQRYFTTNFRGVGKYLSTTSAILNDSLPVTMRAAPTAALIAGTQVLEIGVANRNASAISASSLTPEGGYIVVTTAAATSGNMCSLNTSVATFDSEL